MSRTTSDYVQRARERVVDLLGVHHAMVHPEVESRIAESGFADYPYNIDPHHITTALRTLHDDGIIRTLESPARGGHRIRTIQLADVGKTKTATEIAARRKRLLLARYTGWSQGTHRNPQGLIGPAGERAVRAAILGAETVIPLAPGAGETAYILGHRLPGAVDSAGFMVPVERGIPLAPVTLLFEVKNLRSWIYPSSAELYQLLQKAVLLQRARPGNAIVPVLVCRRAHKTTFWMARQLGFIAIAMEIQFTGTVDQRALDEVRTELHFTDIRVGDGPSLRVRDRVRDTLPMICSSVAENWRATVMAQPLADAIEAVRLARSTNTRRQRVDELRAVAVGMGHQGGW